jgi:predicted PurR-regulated permease PerM
MGALVRLHPAVVIFAILAGGALVGVFGLLISIPIAAVTRILPAYVYRTLVDAPEPSPPPDTESSGTAAPKIGHAGAYASSSGS